MKTTASSLDVIPSEIIKASFSEIGTSIQLLINSSLTAGVVPKCFKHAVVQPLLKKQGLEEGCLDNYRPVSKLSFLSKLLEKVVYSQLISFLNEAKLTEPLQSGFSAQHSTESALLKVFNDILLAVDSGKNTVLLLLDLTAAFDTVDHNILLCRLERLFGIGGIALQWFNSYIRDRTFSVELGKFSSSVAPIICGVPQGSILGPLLFNLYMRPLGDIIRRHNVSFHLYADDTQLYIPLKAGDTIEPLLACLGDIKKWLSNCFLRLNEEKTEVIVFGPPKLRSGLINELGKHFSSVSSQVRNLGVILDSELCLTKQMNTVVKNSFYQLWIISRLKSFLSFNDLEKVIHAFITSRLDYCNSLYLGLPQSSTARLQMVQNAAARLLTRAKKTDRVTPILASLHWLPVHFRIQLKILLFVFKALNGQAPSYLTDHLTPLSSSRSLRSSDRAFLAVPRSRLKTKGDRAFSIAAPRLWNKLPLDICLAPSITTFKTKLKTYLYSQVF